MTQEEVDPDGAFSRNEAERKEIHDATWAHVGPFAFWILWIIAVGRFGDPTGWTYAFQSVIGLGVLLYFRPWRWYAPLRARNIPLALFTGVVVLIVWIIMETPWMARWPAVQDFYLNYAVLPWGAHPEYADPSNFAPEVCGWPLTIMRLLGSAFVIAVMEEFFWRGFLYRWLLGRNFLKVDLGKRDLAMFIAVSVVFGLEHAQWLVGILAGLAYLWLMVRTRDIWAAALAHVVTNLLLGLYVIVTGQYGFW